MNELENKKKPLWKYCNIVHPHYWDLSSLGLRVALAVIIFPLFLLGVGTAWVRRFRECH